MRKTYPIPFAILLLAGCGAKEEKEPKPIVAVKVARAEVADVRISVLAPASVYGREQANLNARITAHIGKLHARKGDRVAAGQLLATLDSRDLLAQRDEAAAAVTSAEANLRKLSAGSLPTDAERARGQVETTAAALNQTQTIYERRRQLFEQGAIPQREVLVSQTDFAQAKTANDVAKKSLDLLLNQSRDQDIQMAKSQLEQAGARLRSMKAQLEFTEIRSPFAGAITEQFMFPGDMAKPDAPIFTVIDLAIAVARAQVPEGEAAAVRSGQACAFTPSDGGGPYQGKVSVVNQAVDPAKRTVETWCEIPNAQAALRSGAFGSLLIATGSAPKSVVVPLAAVQFEEGTKKGIVMLVGEKNLAVKRAVEAGEVFEGKVQIKSGLSAGDPVIVQGAYGLPEGTEVKLAEEKKP